MAIAKPKGIHAVKAKGRVYYYAWRGGPPIKAAYDTPAFWSEFAELSAARKVGDSERLSGLITAYKASPNWLTQITERTRQGRTRWLDKIDAKFGKLHVIQFDRLEMKPLIIDWRAEVQAEAAKNPRADDGARTADEAMQMLSVLLSYGQERAKLKGNLCFGIKKLYASDRADLIWTPDDLALLEKTACLEVFQVARGAELTGLRKSDLFRLSWPHIKANCIEIETGKSNGRRTTLIPMYDELRAFLETVPKRNMTVFTNKRGDPWGTSFDARWQEATEAAEALIEGDHAKAAFDELHFHDLRGTAATRFYKAGITDPVEIAEIMAWSPKAVASILRKYVYRNALVEARIQRLNANAARTKV